MLDNPYQHNPDAAAKNPPTQGFTDNLGLGDLVRRSATEYLPPPQRELTPVAKLIDVSKCIGCKACQSACIEWNDLRDEVGVNGGVYDNPADLAEHSWAALPF